MASRLPPDRGRVQSGSRVPVPSRSSSIRSLGGGGGGGGERARSREHGSRRRLSSRDRGGGAAWEMMQQHQISESIGQLGQQMQQLMDVVSQQQLRMVETQSQLQQVTLSRADQSRPEFQLFGGMARSSTDVPTAGVPTGGIGASVPSMPARPFLGREGSPQTVVGGSPGIFPASFPQPAANPFGTTSLSPSSRGSQDVGGQPPNPQVQGAGNVPVAQGDPQQVPRIVMPDDSSFPLSPVNPGPNGVAGGGFGGSRELDAFQKSDKWLPAMPTIDSSKWKGRIEEITQFETYVESLVSWVGLISDSFAGEIAYSVRSPAEISQDSLTPQQVSRGLRLLNILKTAFFNGIPKASVILSAYTEQRNANYLVNGFEALRRLSKEFCVRTRSEAMHFRSLVMSKTYKVSTVTELVNSLDFDIHRYAKLTGSLGPGVDRTGLDILPIDLSMILLRSLKPNIRQYVVMHSQSEDYNDLRQAALRFESSQRLWQEVSTDPKNDNYYAQAAIKGKGKGKKGDEKGKGAGKDKGPKDEGKAKGKGGKSVAKPTDVCWNCGKTGHFGRDCKAPKPKEDDAGKHKEKGKGKDKKGDAKGGKKGKGKGGKNNAVTGDVVQPELETSPSHENSEPLISMILLQESANDLSTSFSANQTFVRTICACISCECSYSPVDVDFELSCISSLIQGNVNCIDRHFRGWTPSALCCAVHSSLEPSPDDAWWLLDSGASYSVLSGHASRFYEIVGKTPFPRGVGDFSAANGSKIMMKEFVVVAITVWAKDLRKQHEPNQFPVPMKIFVHALVADNIINNVLSLGSVLRNGWQPKKSRDLLSLVSDDGHFELHVEHHQNCPWLQHEFDLSDDGWGTQVVGELPKGALDQWQMFEPLPDSVYQMPIQPSEALSSDLPLHVSVKRDRDGNAIPLRRSHGKQTPVDVEQANEFPETEDLPGILEDQPGAVSKIPNVGPSDGPAEISPDAQLDIADSLHPKVQQRKIELQRHIMRGHYPYSPECIQCRQGKSTYQHRRKKDGTDIHELSADFFFYQQQKFLVMFDSYTGMTGIAPIGNLEQSRRWIRQWVSEFGLLGPLSNNHALEVFTDSEKAVGNLIRQADVGRPVKLQKAPPQGHETVGAAETSIRKLKDSISTLRASLREFSVDLANSVKARCSAFAYLCFCNMLIASFGMVPYLRENWLWADRCRKLRQLCLVHWF